MGKYYLLYEMMINSLNDDDVFDGLNKSLLMLKSYLNTASINLYKKDKRGIYVQKNGDTSVDHLSRTISGIVNKTYNLTEHKKIFKLDLNQIKSLNNMYLMSLETDESKYILSINNSKNPIDSNFLHMIQDTLLVILKRAEIHERNMKAINMDLLTELENRNSYEKRIQNINDSEGELVFAIFDLFRLKYVNDNYSHSLGDEYIKKAAKILKKYWPSSVKNIVDGVEKDIKTGHTVYRTGGDEFILLTNSEKIEMTKVKAMLAAEEVSMFDLGIDGLPLGLNYGVVKHDWSSSIKETYEQADKAMSENKERMYETFELERRR